MSSGELIPTQKLASSLLTFSTRSRNFKAKHLCNHLCLSSSALLTCDPTDLQSVGKASSVSWQESLAGPKHAPVWTCVCKSNVFPCNFLWTSRWLMRHSRWRGTRYWHRYAQAYSEGHCCQQGLGDSDFRAAVMRIGRTFCAYDLFSTIY